MNHLELLHPFLCSVGILEGLMGYKRMA